ncbi:UNVERIFIED_CONTAM: hypothetical protein Sangu_3131900 [Sesamum angustifolium]|uniref:Uncharacterized protein n=1 Tax=Sesamum angustifolium TaxID=2727405 RepID=A0AAW2K2K3_9LAMI
MEGHHHGRRGRRVRDSAIVAGGSATGRSLVSVSLNPMVTHPSAGSKLGLNGTLHHQLPERSSSPTDFPGPAGRDSPTSSVMG